MPMMIFSSRLSGFGKKEKKVKFEMPARRPLPRNKQRKPHGWDRRREAGWDSRFVKGGLLGGDDQSTTVSTI